MKKLILKPIAALWIATCALASTPPVPITGAERVTLAGQADASLLGLRAGVRPDTVPLRSVERDALERAQAAEAGLLEMRAGMHVDLTHDEWTIVAIVLVVILILVLI